SPPMEVPMFTEKRAEAPGTAVAQALKPRGYRTAFISAGYNEWANQAAFVRNRGFDVLWDATNAGCPEISSWGVEDRCMVDMVLRFIDTHERGKPFFVMSWTQGTHHPYEPAPTWEEIDFLKGEKKY